MRTSVIPDLIDAMVTGFAALTGMEDVSVSDGLPLSNNEGTYLYVGVSDPNATQTAAARSTQTWPLATFTAREETGDITLAVESIDGGGDIKAVRDEVFRVAGLIQDHLRTSKTLGVAGVLWLSYSDSDLDQAQAPAGAAAMLTFKIHYTARI